MPARRVNPNLVKTHFSYTAQELAERLSVHKNTVCNWQRQGLDAIDDSRPLLFQGETVRAFLKDRRASRKRPCPDGKLYCVSCREPRRPAMAMVEYVPLRETSGNLRGICETCDTIMHRRIRVDDLEAKMPDCEVKISQAPPSLSGQASPSDNCGFKKEG